MENGEPLKFSTSIKIIYGTIILLAASLLAYGIFNADSYNDSYRKSVLKLEYTNDTISKKYIDYRNHGIPSIKIGNPKKSLPWIKDKWMDLIVVGDTINKKQNSLEFTINKKNGEIHTFDFQICINELDSLGYIN